MRGPWVEKHLVCIVFCCLFPLFLPLTGCGGGGGGGGDSETQQDSTGTEQAEPSPEPVFLRSYPNSGSTSGGEKITIEGLYLGETERVMFGGVEAGNLQIVDDSTIVCYCPSWIGDPVSVDIAVKTPDGLFVETEAFTYFDTPPPVHSLSITKDRAEVHLSWNLAGPVEEIVIYRGGQELVTLAGNAEAHTYDEDSYGVFRLSVVAISPTGQRSIPASNIVDLGVLVWDPVAGVEGYRAYVFKKAPEGETQTFPPFEDYSYSLSSGGQSTANRLPLKVFYDEGLMTGNNTYIFAVTSYIGTQTSDFSNTASCEYEVRLGHP